MKRILATLAVAVAVMFALPSPAQATVIHYGTNCITYGPGIGEPAVNVCMFVYLDSARSSQYTKGQATITRNVAGKNCAYDIDAHDYGSGVDVAWNTGQLCKVNTSFTRNTIADLYSPSDGWYRDDCDDSYDTGFNFQVYWPSGATTGVLQRFSQTVNGSAMAPFCV